MTSPVADGVRAGANIPPSGAQLNVLDLALEQILRSNVSTAVLNGTSSAVVSSAGPSATDAQNISASASASAASEVSSASPPSDVSSSLVAPQSASTASASVASAAASASAEGSSSDSARETAPSPRNASPSDGALSVPKNVALSSSSSLADSSPAPTPAPEPSTTASSTGAKESATFKTNPAATSATAASSSPAISTSASEPDAAPAPEPFSSSSVASESSTIDAAPTTPQVPSTSTNAATTQRDTQSSTLALASSNNEVSPSQIFNGAGVPSTNEASPRPGNTSISYVNQGGQGNSPTSASLRSGQSSPTGSISNSTTDLGNGFIGITSPSHVDSTLSTPEAVTITSGSQTFVTTPSFITSISVLTGSNGFPVATFTSVFANPTYVPGVGRLANDRSFWDNKDAVAGVFAAVALVLLSTIFGTVFCCRRRRRRLAPGFDNAQFRRFSSPPEMTQHPTTYQPVRERGFAADDSTCYPTAPSSASGRGNGQEESGAFQHTGSQGLGLLTGIPARPPGLTPPDYESPFSDYHRYISTGDTRLGTPPGGPVGIAVSSDFEGKAEGVREGKAEEVKTERRSPSPAPSSPSIYPPSLPTVKEKDEDDYLFYEQETKRRPESQSKLPIPPPKAVVKSDSEPQSPFLSPLDHIHDTGLKRRTSEPAPIMTNTNSSYRPLTPPDSSAGHSPTTPHFSESSTKPLNISRYSNAFLGRSVSTRTEHLPRPPRNPLRLSTSGSSLRDDEEP